MVFAASACVHASATSAVLRAPIWAARSLWAWVSGKQTPLTRGVLLSSVTKPQHFQTPLSCSPVAPGTEVPVRMPSFPLELALLNYNPGTDMNASKKESRANAWFWGFVQTT